MTVKRKVREMETDKAEKEKKESAIKDSAIKESVMKKRGRPIGSVASVARERTWSGGTAMKSLDEFVKRKREGDTEEEGDESEAFKRSKMIMRSPQKEKKVEEIDELAKIILGMEGKLGEKLESFKEEFRMWKTEQQKREEVWRREREELMEEVRELKRRLDKIENEREEARREIAEQKEERKNSTDKGKETEIIRKSLEIWKENEERQKRRRNIIIKGVDKEGKSAEEIVTELWGVMEVSSKTEEISELGKRDKKGKRMILVKMKEREGKTEIMKNKRKLRERNEKIQDDWTWKERSMQWNLEKIAWEERKKGNTAWVKYGKIWKDERWWRWNEEEEKLEEGDGEERREKREEARGKRKVEEERREVDMSEEK